MRELPGDARFLGSYGVSRGCVKPRRTGQNSERENCRPTWCAPGSTIVRCDVESLKSCFGQRARISELLRHASDRTRFKCSPDGGLLRSCCCAGASPGDRGAGLRGRGVLTQSHPWRKSQRGETRLPYRARVHLSADNRRFLTDRRRSVDKPQSSGSRVLLLPQSN